MEKPANRNGKSAVLHLLFQHFSANFRHQQGSFAMASEIRPRARADELVVRDMDSEVLIYDLNKDEAITLNPFAAAVWRACDGSSGVAGLSAKLQDQMPGYHVPEERSGARWTCCHAAICCKSLLRHLCNATAVT